MHVFVPASERHLVAVAPAQRSHEELLDRLASLPCHVRDDLRGGSNREGGSASQLGSFLELGDQFLKATHHRRYASPEIALECEWDDEIRRQQLGIYPPGRTWFLSLGADSAFWACSLTPRLPILRDLFNRPVAASGDGSTAWDVYLDAFRMTFELASRAGVLLDCNPNNFGVGADRVYYVDDDLMERSGRAPFGHQILLRLQEYADAPLADRVAFLSRFAELVAEFSADEVLRQGVVDDLEQRITWPAEPELREILETLLARLSPPVKRF